MTPPPPNPDGEGSPNKTKLADNPASKETLKRTILGWTETFQQSTECNDDPLWVIASVADLRIFKDYYDNFYADYPVALSVEEYSSSQSGKYSVTRRRHRVSRKFALLQILLAAVPDELFDLLPKELLVAENDPNDKATTKTPSKKGAVPFTGPDGGFKKN
ncbi:MAG: hypothetical protein ACLPRE_11380 [Limisphaerales bacterium]